MVHCNAAHAKQANWSRKPSDTVGILKREETKNDHSVLETTETSSKLEDGGDCKLNCEGSKRLANFQRFNTVAFLSDAFVLSAYIEVEMTPRTRLSLIHSR